LIAAKKLEEQHVRTNVTLVFTVSQVLQVVRIGAKFVTPFFGWQESAGGDCSEFMSEVLCIINNFGFEIEVISSNSEWEPIGQIRGNGSSYRNSSSIGL
jgi:transaldolase